eukprot:TRINITY_DN5854_c0_g4_i5.p3 TRINITY_DN5854_c0_g4~~TRINITY_DN5854_c0_g4_i5.p3  ORF type:complete len:117 (+),score=18.96 TRINITY_DN5854_c0_g4_i5:2392-2742(+)
MVWQDRLPRVDADLSDPKIHEVMYKHLRQGYTVHCKLGHKACTCRGDGGSFDGTRFYACKNAVAVPGWWRSPWVTRGVVGVPSLYLCYRVARWWAPKEEKVIGRYQYSAADIETRR